jgi:GNAT superfamily N-acetyltransferase
VIHFQREHLTGALLDELQPLLQAHYDELTLNKDRVKLRPKWREYYALQANDMFVALTARDGTGRLVGYNAFFVNTHMHYADLRVAVNDVFYLHPDHRRGATALRFLRFTEDYFKDRVHKVAYHFKAANNFGPILQRIGYSAEEGVAAKLL